METKQVKAVQDAATAAASRDDSVTTEWAFHDFILGALGSNQSPIRRQLQRNTTNGPQEKERVKESREEENALAAEIDAEFIQNEKQYKST